MRKLYLLTISLMISAGAGYAQMANTQFQTAPMVSQVGNEVVLTFTTSLQEYIEEYILCRTVNGTTVEIITAAGSEYNPNPTPYTITPTGINDPDTDLAISVFPNPMVDLINVEQPRSPVPLDVTVVNALGQVVMVHSQTATERSISVSDLREGVYLMKLSRNDETIRTIRLLKTN